MKFQLISDLHLDSNGLFLPKPLDPTTLIIAGDMGTINAPLSSEYIMAFLKQASRLYQDIIVVFGNHEFYHGSLLTSHHVFEQLLNKHKIKNVVCLEESKVQYDDVVVIGATCWTSMNNANLDFIQYMVNDYSYIYTSDRYHSLRNIDEVKAGCLLSDRLITPTDTRDIHHESMRYIMSEVAEAKKDGLKTIVVTHHAPSYKSVSPQFFQSPENPAFVSDYDELIINEGPDFWLHGHVHTNWDYMIGNTRIMCNPRGYRNETTNFRLDKFFSI